MQNKRIIYIIAGGLALFILAILIVSYMRSRPAQPEQEQLGYQLIAETDGMVLMADVGLNIEWLVDRQDGRREIFERFRVVSKAQFEQLTGTETIVNSVDITQDNVEVFLTYPDGTRENLASDVPYIPFAIFPPSDAGIYKLDVKLNSGEEYNFEFEFKEPKKVELIATGKTRIEENTQTEGGLLGHPESEQGNHEVSAFSLDVLDLNKATSVFHITPGNAAYGGRLTEARGLVDIDKYFWLDIRTLQANYTQIQETIEEINEKPEEERTPTEIDFLESIKSSILYEHIFMAKIDGLWHYAVANYPEDF